MTGHMSHVGGSPSPHQHVFRKERWSLENGKGRYERRAHCHVLLWERRWKCGRRRCPFPDVPSGRLFAATYDLWCVFGAVMCAPQNLLTTFFLTCIPRRKNSFPKKEANASRKCKSIPGKKEEKPWWTNWKFVNLTALKTFKSINYISYHIMYSVLNLQLRVSLHH